MNLTATEDAWSIESEHYIIYAEVDRDRAEDISRMVESLWNALEEYFEYSPVLSDNEKLQIKILSNRERWIANMAKTA